MTGKSREVAEMLKRRKVEIACVQETKWKEKRQRNWRRVQALLQRSINGNEMELVSSYTANGKTRSWKLNEKVTE